MLADYIENSKSALSSQWTEALPGVHVCRFASARSSDSYPVAVPSTLKPNHYEAFFCQGGSLMIKQLHRGLYSVGSRDILLVSNCCDILFSQISVPLQGILVDVDTENSAESLKTLSRLLGNLKLHPDLVKQCMDDAQGCFLLRSAPWSQYVFTALDTIPLETQGMYCVLKTFELLYLICTNSTLLTEPDPPSTGSYLTSTVTEMRDYMENHIDEKLTIDTMSRMYNISPTAFKSCFRKLFGEPVHRWLLTQRMKRAAELLQTTPMSVLQIAQAVGYEGVSQFNVVFKRRYGVTPGQYKKLSEAAEI